MRRVQIRGKYDYRPWPEMRHAAAVLRRIAGDQERGRSHTISAAIVMTAFSIEGLCQTLGPEVLGDAWLKGRRPGERLPVLEKLTTIALALNVSVDFAITPWIEIKQIFDARDSLAHPKPQLRQVDDVVEAAEDSDPRELMQQLLAERFQPLHNLSALERISAAVDAALLVIWQAAGRDPGQFTMHGGSLWAVSPLTE